MTEAWVVRSCQRQQLIEKLMHKLYDKEDKIGEQDIDRKTFRFNLVMVIVSFLKYGGVKDNESRVRETTFFAGSILQPVESFARSESERNVLVCDILDKVLALVTQKFHSILQSDEIYYPQRIFNAPSAMADVPLEDVE